MTTERRKAAFPIAGLATALVLWFGGMGVAAYGFDPSAVIVFGPGGTAIAAIANSDGELLTAGVGFATATSDRAGFVRRLYAARRMVRLALADPGLLRGGTFHALVPAIPPCLADATGRQKAPATTRSAV